MLLSVIIPFFNSSSTLQVTLDSLVYSLQQSTESYEIIIVDDGSHDSEKVILRQIASKISNTRIIELKNNCGVSYAKNIGFEASSGQYICFFDADDVCSPNKFKDQIDFFQNSGSNIACVFSDWELRYNDRVVKKYPFESFENSYISGSSLIFGLLFPENFIATGSQLFKRSAISDVKGFDTSRILIEDVHLMIKMASFSSAFYKLPCSDFNFRYIKSNSGSSHGKPLLFNRSCLDNVVFVLGSNFKIDLTLLNRLNNIVYYNLFSVFKNDFGVYLEYLNVLRGLYLKNKYPMPFFLSYFFSLPIFISHICFLFLKNVLKKILFRN
jgi:glycosyltransferase involved in cell wall biosynthesis